jgi:8-oxo-dGTP diphosphatase
MKKVTAAIIMQNGKILLTRRGPSEKLAGYWEFPGGKVEQGESLQECLKRELYEELGIETYISDVISESEYHYDHGSFRMFGLMADILSGELTLHVHDQYDWSKVEDLLSYNLAPADVPIAEKVMMLFGG